MNQAQARAIVALYDRISELDGRSQRDLELGRGDRIVNVEVEDGDSDLEGFVNDLGWIEVTVWMGGVGATLLMNRAGQLFADDGDAPAPAVLTMRPDPFRGDETVWSWAPAEEAPDA